MKLIFTRGWRKRKSLCPIIKELVESHKEYIIERDRSFIKVTCEVEYSTLGDKYIVRPKYYMSKDTPSEVFIIGVTSLLYSLNKDIYKKIKQYFDVTVELRNCEIIKPNGLTITEKRYTEESFKRFDYETSY